MAHEYFVQMHEGGVHPRYMTEPMTVFLYPWSSDQESAVDEDGTVTMAIKNVAEQLLDHNAIDFYRIYRWKYEDSDTNYPEWGDIDDCSYDDISDNFKSWLKDDGDPGGTCGSVGANGTGRDHYGLTGVHELVHGGYTGCNETKGYAPNGAGAERWGETAFREGRIAWAPVCSDTALTRAAAAQEALHMFMHGDYDGTDDCDSYTRQHSIGSIRYHRRIDYSACTPMLAYHWDGDNNENPDCLCPREAGTPDSHTLSLTECTKDAVKRTADAKL